MPLASAPVSTTPSVPVYVNASAPVKTTPSAPVSTTPSAPVKTTPSAPVRTTPSAPVRTTPWPGTSWIPANVEIVRWRSSNNEDITLIFGEVILFITQIQLSSSQILFLFRLIYNDAGHYYGGLEKNLKFP